MVELGIDRFSKDWPKSLRGARVGLLVHSASVNSRLEHTALVVKESRLVELKVLFGPQHGLYGETQANMIEWEGYRDPITKLKVFSLYGKVRKPTPEMLEDLDGIIVDLQDVGARYYTYIWTLYLAMEACKELNKFVVVLDRPNPISGAFIEGPVLNKSFSSFVGLKPLPIRHGMTMGELALYFKEKYLKGLELYIVKMKNWKRKYFWSQTGLEWVNPSPNMPSERTALLYPGICLLEGTNLSEGRGTTRPFELVGAPFIDPVKLAGELNRLNLEGVFFRPVYFVPTFDKYQGERCGGVQIHVLDKVKIKPFKAGVAILKTVFKLYPEHFQWREGPYEYEYVKKPIDILCGNDYIRRGVENNIPLSELEEIWSEEAQNFDKNVRRAYLLYG